MKIKTLFILLLSALLHTPAFSQVTVEAKLDSAQILIGERIGLSLEVSADSKNDVQMPQWDSLQMILPGIELLSATPVDTEYVNEGKRKILRQKYYITSFDTALYLIPSVDVKVDDSVYHSNKLAMKVLTFDIDTVHVDSICGYKDIMAPEFSWDDWSLVLWLSVFSVIITMLLIYVAIRLKDNKPIIRRIRNKKHLPPHKAAMQKIETIKEDTRLWQMEDSKEYYTQLTDTLRQYIFERYGFNALEMTSFEIIEHLQKVNDEDALRELRELFQTADLVKFAKYNTLINENDRNLVYAMEYINQTKQEETEEQKQPEEIIVVEPRSLKTKRILIAGVSVTAIALIGIIAYLCYRIYMLTI